MKPSFIRPVVLKILLCVCFLYLHLNFFAQQANVVAVDYTSYTPGTFRELNSIQKVDSIGQMTNVASSFARIYSHVMKTISTQIQDFETPAQQFIINFELHFSDFFLSAYYDHCNGKLSQNSEWECLFSHPGVESWQTVFLGVNAHTNIDIWQALAYYFPREEIRRHKKQLLSVQRSIAKVYNPLFHRILESNGYLKFINSFTWGLAKFAGERWVYKWRKRNVKLALLYFDHPKKFRKKLLQVRKKKQRIDRLILDKKKFLL